MKNFPSKRKYRQAKQQSPGQVRRIFTGEKKVLAPWEHQNIAPKPVGARAVSRNASQMRHKTSAGETRERPTEDFQEERENVASPSCC